MNLAIKIARQADSSYRAWCPGLPGCVVSGYTRAEARWKARRAVEGYIGALDVALPRELARACPAALAG